MRRTANSILVILGFCLAATSPALAGDAPSIGGGAVIEATVGQAGVVNTVSALGGNVTAKQHVGSIIAGNVSGAVAITANVAQGGVVNTATAKGGNITACQDIGTIGNNC